MKQFKTVMKFEYLGYIKNKPFIIATGAFIVLILVACMFPQIINLFSSITGSKTTGVNKAIYVLGDDALNSGLTSYISPEKLNESISGYQWDTGNEKEQLEEKIKNGYNIAFYYNGGLSYDFYAASHDFSAYPAAEKLDAFIKDICQQESLKHITTEQQQTVNSIMNMNIERNQISVGGDAMKSFWLAYVLVFVLYIVIILYGQFIVVSVVTEKSSKAMELLITSAKPTSLMSGKVVGVGASALTQFLAIILTGAVGFWLNINAWKEFMPEIFEFMNNSAISVSLIVYFLLFFLLGYFMYAFLYAALASTASRMEDASSVVAFPMILVVIGFIASITSITKIDTLLIKTLSFIPFFSPMVMFTRICMGAAALWEILAALGLLLLGTLFTGWIGAKIYRMGVLIYGKPMKISEILRALKY